MSDVEVNLLFICFIMIIIAIRLNMELRKVGIFKLSYVLLRSLPLFLSVK